MHAFLSLSFVAAALAAEPWINAPDSGLEDYLYSTNYTEGSLPLLKDIRGVPDFDWAAEQYLPLQEYSFYRTGSAGEWSKTDKLYTNIIVLTVSSSGYRNNLDIWSKIKFRARMLTDVSGVNETLPCVYQHPPS